MASHTTLHDEDIGIYVFYVLNWFYLDYWLYSNFSVFIKQQTIYLMLLSFLFPNTASSNTIGSTTPEMGPHSAQTMVLRGENDGSYGHARLYHQNNYKGWFVFLIYLGIGYVIITIWNKTKDRLFIFFL